MHSKLKPGFIRLNTLALAAALALACTLALLFCGCQSKAEREKLAEEGLLYYKNLDFNNAKRFCIPLAIYSGIIYVINILGINFAEDSFDDNGYIQ